MKKILNIILKKIIYYRFYLGICKLTWKIHSDVVNWAVFIYVKNTNSYKSKVGLLGYELRGDSLEQFNNKFKNSGHRILIHIPPKSISPGGHSLFTNLASSLEYLGISVGTFSWNSTFEDIVKFSPTIFLSSDNDEYKTRIDWNQLNQYRLKTNLKIGLTASIEAYGNTSLDGRLEWAKANNIDFYYSFRSPEYLAKRPDYAPFYLNGYKVFSIEFGANPIYYYPIDFTGDKFDYIFLASNNMDKVGRYYEWLSKITSNYVGFIDGPGWPSNKSVAEKKIHSLLYSRAKIGLNLHINDSILWESELNERTYILGACGIPQLIDNPKLLLNRYSSNSMFISNDPDDYMKNFQLMLHNKDLCEDRAIRALVETYEKHTTFHRAEKFIRDFEIHEKNNL